MDQSVHFELKITYRWVILDTILNIYLIKSTNVQKLTISCIVNWK